MANVRSVSVGWVDPGLDPGETQHPGPVARCWVSCRPPRRVGEDVSTLAPHRPGRADFPHPVPHVERFAAAAYRWTIMARGSGWRTRSALKRAHVSRLARVRRSSHFRHSLVT